MSLKNRLDLIIKELSVSGRQFARECGFSESYYATINDGIGADKLNKIASKYPQISLEWLITGEGEMLKKLVGNKDQISSLDEKYLKILEINARTMESQQKTIADLSAKLAGKGAAEGVKDVAPREANG